MSTGTLQMLILLLFRRFLNLKPPQNDKMLLELILEAANVAPTGCNYQPQRIYVVKSEEALAKINEASKCIFGAKTVLIFAYDKGEDWKNRLEEGVHSGVQDVSIVATHAMMEAWECGVGSYR